MAFIDAAISVMEELTSSTAWERVSTFRATSSMLAISSIVEEELSDVERKRLSIAWEMPLMEEFISAMADEV